MKLFDNLREDFGMAPVSAKAEEKEKEPDVKSSAPEEPEKKQEEAQKEPEKEPEAPKGKAVHLSTIDEVVEFLKKKGYNVERRDVEAANKQPEPAPEPAPFVPAEDTTPKAYQNPHLGVRFVQDGSFYNGLANSAYDFDRCFGHGETKLDPAIISWIGSLYPDVPELAEDFVKNRLRDTLMKQPNLIAEVKKTADEVAKDIVPYSVSFISKLDGQEYESAQKAKDALGEKLISIGATVRSAYKLRYTVRHYDGTSGKIVTPGEVMQYILDHEDNKEKLCRELWITQKDLDKFTHSENSSVSSNADT